LELLFFEKKGNNMKILIVGDVFSKLGREALARNIKRIKEEQKINFIIVNGENITHGRGMNEGHYLWLLEQGVNVITMGNHTFNQRSIYNYMDDSKCLVRPMNYLEEVPGRGYVTVNYNGTKITVFQMLGQVFMNEEVKNPFTLTKEFLETIDSDIIICDFHAESTSEKIAFGYAFDGKITCVYGTHTHVQTNDARILSNNTAYISDVGMTGPYDGVIGVQKDIIVDRYMNDGKIRFSPAEEGAIQFSAIILEINDSTKKVTKIDTIHMVE